MEKRLRAEAGAEDSGVRLDVFLAGRFPDFTRSRLKNLIDEERVTVNGRAAKAAYKLEPGDAVELTVPEPRAVAAQAEDIPLDIVYEDDSLIVINKRRGLVVHPAAGNETGTLVNALLNHCDDLSGIAGEIKPGIVHRLDKDTTGLLVAAKTDAAHLSLSRQIAEKTAKRIYLALVEGNVASDNGRIEAALGRSRSDRKKIAVVEEGGRAAATQYYVLERFGDTTLVECHLETGRTHQIRVHMKHIGHPVVGDPVYGFRHQRFSLQGQLLHAARLEFTHPLTNERMKFELRMEFYNFTNSFMPNQPNLSVTSSIFGKSTGVAGGNYGREIQYTARIHF
jgi:23S rRNA pseudouridine1911/1915/1917 synthase